jgi:imidazolonepropionase-like amidohydrolase
MEMDRWLETDIGLRNLFTTMTVASARALGLEKTLGSVQVRMQANLLLLKDNPLLKVSAYDTIEQVILSGTAHDRKIFSAQVDVAQARK